MDEVRKNEIIAVILVSIGIFLLLSIFTFTSQDLFFYTSDPNPVSQNMAGTWGAYLSGAMLFFVGKAAYVVPMLIILWGVSRFMQMRPDKMFLKFFGIAALLIAAASALGITSVLNRAVAFQRGGVVGTFVSEFLFKYLGMVGAVVFLVALIILSMLIATDFLLFPLIVRVYKGTARAMENAKDKISEKVPLPTVERVPAGKLKDAKADIAKKLEIVRKQVEESRRSVMTDRKSSDTPSGSAVKRSQNQAEDITVTTSNPKFVKPKPVKVAQPAANRIQNADGYKLPSLELLITSPKTAEKDREEDFKLKAALLEKTLLEFEVDAKVVKINKGPVITMYELEPAIGTKVNEITSLTDNISLSMKSTNIRIVAPLPGKGTIGIEVPNDKIEMVRLKDIIQTEDFVKEDSPLKIALGKDIMGNPMVLDLAAMPHLLIAGATGSGKTVCINCIISSMLFSSAPSDLKFIMVDPKRVELQMFEGIPHLLCPIVTNPKKVASILAWLIGEMERRYTVFADKGVRNIASYKERAAKDWERLPYIVLIIDELADLMVSARQDVEGSIMRLAQLSRAAGIHMILATQ
ncbi:MAG TPA: DNA translocase FtsK 4TM domain-containing protein, partial [Candidatus Omnitrophota bacterium]|nr:DNA translocase FtsK 4TM domain-containing protein [Candidatus Omnitrophota bacterium]